MEMAEEGDHRSMDVLISDIYEGRTRNLGLPEDLIAGSFGRVSTDWFFYFLHWLEILFLWWIVYVTFSVCHHWFITRSQYLLSFFLSIVIFKTYFFDRFRATWENFIMQWLYIFQCANADFVRKVRQDPNYKMNVLRSLLLMISNSLGQVIYRWLLLELAFCYHHN